MRLSPTRVSSALAVVAILFGAFASRAASLDEARALHRAGDLESAAAAYRSVLEDRGLDEASMAIASNNLCVVLDALGDHASAEGACRRALELRLSQKDRLRLARTLNNLGLVLQHLGRYERSEERFSEALAINRELEDFYAQAINLSNLGAVATLAGRFQDALEWNRAVAKLAGERSDQAWAAEQLQIAGLNRGVVLERLGAYREALGVYQSLLAEETDLGRTQRASVLVNAGVIYRNLGDPVRAIEHFESAAVIYRDTRDLSGMGHAELNIGIARHLNLDDTFGAEAAYRSALALVERSGERAVEIEALGSLGRLLLATGRAAEARPVFEKGLSLARESGSAEGTWASLAGLGELERGRGDLEASLRHFESAIALIEAGRSGVARAEYRASFFDDKRAVYAGALETLVELDRREGGRLAGRALEVAQRAKARDLLDAFESRTAGSGVGASMMRALDEDELARRLGEDTLIEFFVGDHDLVVWRLEAGSLEMASLGAPGPILEAVEKAHRSMARGSEPSVALVKELATRLLGPLAPLPSAVENLWISPDRELWLLPFEVLPVAEGSGQLVERARISYLPSAWALPETAEDGRPPRTEVTFVGLGGVDVSAGEGYAPWVSRLALEPLDRAFGEVQRVGRRLGGKRRILSGAEATEASFRAHVGTEIGVMHLATHAVSAAGRVRGSAILLTPAGDDDGMLWPAEVAASPSGASLVVLAACSTALGDEQDGRALATLAGSFLAAGSEAVLATLWPVGDQATAVFMDQFYFQLSRGRSPAEALRRTKLRFMEQDQWRNPALWSGYVLVGSASPVVSASRGWMWGGALALLALLALLWRRGMGSAPG